MSVPRITDYLSAEELAALPNLELRARRLVEGFLNGVHRSPFQGCNVEFKEHRKYAYGDEIRSIDWRAFARTDRLHVRLHEEDTNLNTSLLLDRSASMDYRSGKAVMNKYDFARAVAADPKLLLLDEITANLDAETERAVLRALKRATADRTVLSISHRVGADTGRLIPIGEES